MKKPQAYSYVRFSTPDQQKGDSLRRQTHAAEEYASANNLELVDVSFQDLGVSAYRGANADTGKLAEFIEAVEAKLIPRGSYLLIESLDRLSRDKARRAIRLLEDICDLGIIVVTLTDKKKYDKEALDNDSMAFIWAFMIAIRANEESLTKSNRLRAIWEHKRTKASQKPLTSKAPAWLKLDKKNNTFEIIEERATIIRRIFQLASEGNGQHKIAEMLNTEKVPCFGRAKFWHRSYIKKVLQNPAVIGTLIPHKLEFTNSDKKQRLPQAPILNYFPQIVSDEEFSAVISTRNDRRSPSIRLNTSLQNILAGLAECPLCGATMTRVSKGGKQKRGKPKLICTKAKVGAGCTYSSVDLELIETELSRQAETIKDEFPIAGEELHFKIKSLDIYLSDLKDDAKSLVRELRAAPSTIIRDELVALEKQIRDVESELKALIVRQNASSPSLIQFRLQELVTSLQQVPRNREKINLALRTLAHKIIVNYPLGQLEFQWKNETTSSINFEFKFM